MWGINKLDDHFLWTVKARGAVLIIGAAAVAGCGAAEEAAETQNAQELAVPEVDNVEDRAARDKAADDTLPPELARVELEDGSVVTFRGESGVISIGVTHPADVPNPAAALAAGELSAVSLYESLTGESAPEGLFLAEQVVPEADEVAGGEEEQDALGLDALQSDGEGSYVGPIIGYHSDSEAAKFESLYCSWQQWCRPHRTGSAQRTSDETVNFASAVARPFNGSIYLSVKFYRNGWRNASGVRIHEDEVGHAYYFNREHGNGPFYNRRTARMIISDADGDGFDYTFGWQRFGSNTVPGTQIPEWD